ncbi:peroxisome biogenesis factor 2 isoform X1 [Micropterus salmoides]|uniref:peroxisome biogenesis factor 2 isoform X1 n=1 Tax=Micropterus salmoides TaxID=27706 RepID=UPI0018ECCF46|nr:peroxisome biogenesis factor 2 isoform X1 [Micropterus salmoides]XP_045921380.1 peroxisome biogenesis factor 2 isoform X1 [Micropterus dolomieu]
MAGLQSEGNQKRTAGSSVPDAHVDRQIPVLRISQLDALELDSALEQLVWTQFSQCFQNCRPGLLTPLEPELRALLQLLLWRFTLYSSSATVGQSLLSLRYHNILSSSPHYRPLSRGQKLGLALLTTGPRWLQERSHSLLLCLGLSSGGPVSERGGGLLQQGLRNCLTLVSSIAQLASLINFLVFLRKGRHPVLAERIVGARAVFSKPNVIRDITYQYMNRELLWHGFAEFLIYLLPLINTRKLKAAVSSIVFGGESAHREGGEGAAEGQRAWKECGLCGEWPTMPHTVGCQHVFCYYCIKSLSIADAYLTCPKCGAEAGLPEPVKVEVEMIGR